MIAVNVLVQRVYKALNMTGQGESTDGDMAVVAVEELNRLITTLNSQGFISMSQKFLDVPACSSVIFKKFRPDETVPANAVDMEPPEKVDAVSRKMGVRFVPLDSLDEVQMSARNPHAMATSWNYGRDFEPVDGGMREVGLVRFDGRNPYGVRVFYSSKLPNYDISPTSTPSSFSLGSSTCSRPITSYPKASRTNARASSMRRRRSSSATTSHKE